MNRVALFFAILSLWGSDREESVYKVNTPLKGKADHVIENDIEQIITYARDNNYQGISISPDIVPYAERYIPYSNTGYDILVFNDSEKNHAIQVHSTLRPKKLEFDTLVDDAELNILNWCMSIHVDYSSALLCTKKTTNTVIAAALIDHDFNINDTRLHTLYTANKARKNGYARDLLNIVIRLGIMNKIETISLYAASIGEEDYRVDTSTLVSLYEKNGFKKQLYGHHMYGLTESLKQSVVQNPTEQVILLFFDHNEH